MKPKSSDGILVWRTLCAICATPVPRDVWRLAWVLQLIGVICVAGSFWALYHVAQEPDYRQVIVDTALYWGAGEALPQVAVDVGGCSTRGSRGSGGRHSTDSRYADCTVFLSGPADIIPTGKYQFDVRLYNVSATLADEDAHGVGRWDGQFGVRWNLVTVLSSWGQFLSVMWPIVFVVALGIVLLWSPQLIAFMARPPAVSSQPDDD